MSVSIFCIRTLTTIRQWAWFVSLGLASVVLVTGCSTRSGRSPAPSRPPITVAVGPVILEAPITKPAQIYSFDEKPSIERETVLLAQLVEEIETNAQRFLTEQLARQEGLTVVPFQDTRRLQADLATPRTRLTEAQIQELGSRTEADLVLTGLIHDYGVVRWQYWLTGWLAHVTVATTIVGFASGWNPAVVGAYLAVDATTDFPLWWGGASVSGFAFRPVRLHVDARQRTDCNGLIWTGEELAVRVPGSTLAEYPPEQRGRLEIQLEANLKRAAGDLAEAAGDTLRIQPCEADGRPERISTFSVLSLLDWLF
jgi:hypothetical protein